MPLSRRYRLALAAVLFLPVLAATVPRPAPDFSLNMTDGSKLPLTQFRGKVVVLAFISTTCPHCQTVTQLLSPIQREYGPKGVQVLACAMDPNGAQVVPGFIERFQPAFPVGYTEHTAALTFMETSVIAPGFVPKMAFIDRQGVIREQHAGEEPFFKTPDPSIRASLDALLKASPAAGKKHPATK